MNSMSEQDKPIEIKPIECLLGKAFFIPAYQRGYRWTKQQVEDLLIDVWEFAQSQSGEFYCLQPIILKKDGDRYKVIDGQQRLTTIFLILKCMEQFGKESQENFSIEYETRLKSWNFLNEITNLYNKKDKYRENIDFYYMAKAYECINIWFTELAKDEPKKFTSTFLSHTKVIWYEVDNEQQEEEVFARINIGKIPLTNAELIKALFLSKTKANQDEDCAVERDSRVYLKQLQIAGEWDSIENTLQQPSFWHFIYNDDGRYESHIEYIFDLYLGIDKKKSDSERDEFATFRKFQKEFKDNAQNSDESVSENTLDKLWLEMKNYFQIFEEWYADRRLYHLIGYIVATDAEKVHYLIKKWKDKKKDEFEEYLRNECIKSQIKKGMRGIKDRNEDGVITIEDLAYGNPLIKNLLLLFNICIMLKNEDEVSRFPFDRYKSEQWDIEHIHSQKSEIDDKRGWLRHVLSYFTGIDKNKLLKSKADVQEVNDKIESIGDNENEKEYSRNIFEELQKSDKESESLNELFDDLCGHFKMKDEFDTHGIGNLALLNASINRAYKNAPFAVKRALIIEIDKQGHFIPPGTKNIFLKYYSKKLSDLMSWKEEDAGYYMQEMKTVLKEYLPTSNRDSA